jgi:DNA-binding transcriptional MerR regulator
MTEKNYYSMKEVMAKVGMTVYTVRHYTDNGLVPDIKRDEHGNRIFDDEALNWLKAAQFMRECGMSVKEVKAYFDLCQDGPATIQKRIEIMQIAYENNASKLANLQKKQAIIQDRLQHYQDIVDRKTQDDSNPQTWDPRRFC